MITVQEPLPTAQTLTSDAALVAGQHTPVDATTAPITLTLPTPTHVGARLRVEKIDATGNVVTVTGTLRGVATNVTVSGQYDVVEFSAESTSSWRPTATHRSDAALRAAFGLSVAATASADATLVVNKHTPVDATAATRTMPLPTGQSEGARIVVEKIDATTNPVTVTGNMRGAAGQSVSLVGQYEAMSFLADSAGSWHPGPSHKTKAWLDATYAHRGGSALDAKVDFGCKGDGTTDDTVALQAAFTASAGRAVVIPPGTYKYTDTITIPSGARIGGFTEADTVGTTLQFAQLDGRPAFTNDSAVGLSFATIEHLQIISTNTVGTAGVGDCFRLYGLTNNSRFGNVDVRNFKGNAFKITAKTVGTDPTAAGNVVFDQCFILSCGGYAWEIDGYVNATWNMPDVNSCMGGAFHFLNGISNQAQVLINGLWWEGSRTWSSLQPILLENMNSQVVNLISCNFQGFTSSTDVIRMSTTSAANPSLIGCTGYNFTNWINDQVAVATVGFGPRITYLANFQAPSTLIQGPAAAHEIYNTTGTTNQRRYRWAFAGNLFVLSERLDAGGAVRDILYVNGNTGQVEIVGAAKIDGSVGFYGTTPVARQTVTGSRGGNAALASLLTALAAAGLVTDSSTA